MSKTDQVPRPEHPKQSDAKPFVNDANTVYEVGMFCTEKVVEKGEEVTKTFQCVKRTCGKSPLGDNGCWVEVKDEKAE